MSSSDANGVELKGRDLAFDRHEIFTPNEDELPKLLYMRFDLGQLKRDDDDTRVKIEQAMTLFKPDHVQGLRIHLSGEAEGLLASHDASYGISFSRPRGDWARAGVSFVSVHGNADANGLGFLAKFGISVNPVGQLGPAQATCNCDSCTAARNLLQEGIRRAWDSLARDGGISLVEGWFDWRELMAANNFPADFFSKEVIGGDREVEHGDTQRKFTVSRFSQGEIWPKDLDINIEPLQNLQRDPTHKGFRDGLDQFESDKRNKKWVSFTERFPKLSRDVAGSVVREAERAGLEFDFSELLKIQGPIFETGRKLQHNPRHTVNRTKNKHLTEDPREVYVTGAAEEAAMQKQMWNYAHDPKEKASDDFRELTYDRAIAVPTFMCRENIANDAGRKTQEAAAFWKALDDVDGKMDSADELLTRFPACENADAPGAMLLSADGARVLREATEYDFQRGDEILDLEWYLPLQTRRPGSKPEFRFGFDRMIGHRNYNAPVAAVPNPHADGEDDSAPKPIDGVSDGIVNWATHLDPYPIKEYYGGDSPARLGGVELQKAWIKSARQSGVLRPALAETDPERTGPDTPSPDMSMVELVRHSPPRIMHGVTGRGIAEYEAEVRNLAPQQHQKLRGYLSTASPGDIYRQHLPGIFIWSFVGKTGTRSNS